MRRQHSAHHHPQSKSHQFNLFAQPVVSAAAVPEWQTLPAETRQALMKLMVCPILEHLQADSPADQKEAHGDD
ncbi:MAG TPA: hypothetical protein VM659_21595 [Dongiaceae bacterium]|nr:hypothetical protein [Dongiaceae bacterium]